MRSTLPGLTLLTLASLVPLADVAATEWVVAKDGSGQFTEIQPAVDAAQSGDVIWVKSGAYGEVQVFQKALAILGDGTATTTATSFRIFEAPPGFANLSGLNIVGNTIITSNQGTVILRDCQGLNLSLANCKRVYLENWKGTEGSADTVVSLWISSSTFVGSPGKDAIYGGTPGVWTQQPTPGKTAFTAKSSMVLVSNSDFTGGKGGQGSCEHSKGFLDGAIGGHGMEDKSGDCSFWVSASRFFPGAGGSGGTQCAKKSGSIGLKTKATTKLVVDSLGAELYPLSIVTPSYIGQHTTIKIWGHPGDNILLIIGTEAATVVETEVAGFPLGMDLDLGHTTYWPLTRTIGSAGYVTWKHKIPDDPLLLGTPTFIQALLVAPPTMPFHPPMLTGVSVSLISEP